MKIVAENKKDSSKSSGRALSFLEILRMALLLLLIACHYFGTGDYIDVQIIRYISKVSVTGFALITGMFVFSKRSLVFRNISRLIFIILFSIIIASFMSISKDFSFTENIFSTFTGSAFIWYIYAIIPVYILGPLIYKFMNRTKSLNIAIIGFILFAIGIAGWWFNITYAQEKLNIEFFFMHEVGLLFSIPFLISLSFFGFLLKRWMTRNSSKRIFKILFPILLFSLTAIILMTIFLKNPYIGHGNPIITIFGIVLVGLAANIKWYSKKTNWVSKHLYFVYEYHWFWIILYKIVFAQFIIDFPHFQYYVAWFIIGGFASFISIVITEIQIKFWNRYVDPPMMKSFNWFKTKFTKLWTL